jgi:DNA primase
MFPIHNHFGKVVGFTGRIVPSASAGTAGAIPPKYVNSPETPIYNKSRILFGFHLAKSGIREANTAVLVEGQMDLLMVWQDGVRNAVAVSGTALTKDHLKRLRRLAGTLTIAFDGDDAGRAATERAVDMAHELDFTVTVLDLPFALAAHPDLSELKDPADVVLARAGLFGELFKRARPHFAILSDLTSGQLTDVTRVR